MINGVQILLSVGVIIGYQVMIRSFDIFSLEIVYTFSWWHIFIPPIWFSGAFELMYNQLFTTELVILTSLAIIVPILLLFIYSKVMPSFERNLEKLLSDLRQGKKREKRLQSFWAKIVCRSKEEQVVYRFAATMMKQERGFKLKVYPTIAMSIVFPFIFVFGELRFNSFEDLSEGKLFLVAYFCNLLIPTVVHMLKFSDHAEGSWVFGTAPIRHKSALYSGALKAVLVSIYLPTFILVGVAFSFLFSYQVIPSLIAIFLTGVLQTIATYKIINNETVPFSKPFSFVQDSDTAKMIILLLITGLFFLPHLIVLGINNGIYVYLVLQLLAIWISWRTIFSNRGGKVWTD